LSSITTANWQIIDSTAGYAVFDSCLRSGCD